MSEETTEFLELRMIMDNLYQAGMSIEQTVEVGFDVMKDWDISRLRAKCHASQTVRDAADQLGLSRKHHLKMAGEIIALHSRKRDE